MARCVPSRPYSSADEQALELGTLGETGLRGLLEDEIAEQAVPGEVAPQNGIERDADAGGHASLAEQRNRYRSFAQIAAGGLDAV